MKPVTPGDDEFDHPIDIGVNGKVTEEERYDSSIRRALLLSTILFTTALIAGYSLGFHPSITEGQGADDFFNEFRDLFAGFAELTRTELAAFIFVNNAVKSFIFMILGLALGTLPAFFLIINGGVIGLVINLTNVTIGPAFIIAALVPHGILEIPALLYGAALGFKVGSQVWNRIRKQRSFVKDSLTTGVKSFLRLVLPMLLLAALIEAFVTPEVIALVTGL
ncbi:MAG: stage II sporulation protein M [Nitrososphaerales archaeon]